MWKKITAYLSLLCILTISLPVFAQGIPVPATPELWPGEPDVGAAVSPMRKGQAAPFTGVLFSPRAIAIVITELKNIPELVKIETDKTKKVCEAECDFKVKNIQIVLESDMKVLKAKLESSNKENAIFQNRIKKIEDSQPNLTWWVGGGFAVGALTTVLIVFGTSQASK